MYKGRLLYNLIISHARYKRNIKASGTTKTRVRFCEIYESGSRIIILLYIILYMHIILITSADDGIRVRPRLCQSRWSRRPIAGLIIPTQKYKFSVIIIICVIMSACRVANT